MPGELFRVVNGPAAGGRIDLGGELVVGRAEEGAGNLGNDPELSRRHARFRASGPGRVTVEDLGSTNGVYVNGTRISGPQELRPGDRVALGRTTLELEGSVADAGETRVARAGPAISPRPPAPPLPPFSPPRVPTEPGAGRRRLAPILLGVLAFVVVVGAAIAFAVTRGGGGGTSTACVPPDNGKSGAGHFLFITSACENADRSVATFLLHRGTSGGQTVWYVVTDDSNKADAQARGVNYVPKLANAAGSPGVQNVTINNGVIDFPSTVDFSRTRVLQPGPQGFPPAQASPPAVGESGYSPLIQLPDGTVLNAPQVANDTGQADKVMSLDTSAGKVQYVETEGRYEDKHVHYASFESGNAGAAAIEDVTYAPALNTIPSAGAEGLTDSAREELVAFVNGPTGATNPERQGVNSTILDHMDPLNILHETPQLPGHDDVGGIRYAPMWDVHLAAWTQDAINAGSRVQVQNVDTVDADVKEGTVTGPDGKSFGPSGFVVNCPLISIDVP